MGSVTQPRARPPKQVPILERSYGCEWTIQYRVSERLVVQVGLHTANGDPAVGLFRRTLSGRERVTVLTGQEAGDLFRTLFAALDHLPPISS